MINKLNIVQQTFPKLENVIDTDGHKLLSKNLNKTFFSTQIGNFAIFVKCQNLNYWYSEVVG